MEQEVRRAHGQRDLVPLSVSHAVGKGLSPGLSAMYVMVAYLFSWATALQFKIAAHKGTKTLVLGIMVFISPTFSLLGFLETKNYLSTAHKAMT